ncbi:MAG TPA: hypothetical protein VKX17_19655 [Planctomycetota bacterium]|nr:hypothetical protein [Planctomycetota bacterium]
MILKRLIALAIFILMAMHIRAGESATQSPDGVIAWTPAAPAAQVNGEYNATRWGMYDAYVLLEAPTAGTVTATIGGKELTALCSVAVPTLTLGRVYIEKSGKLALSMKGEPLDAAKPLLIKTLTLTPAPEGKPIAQDGDLSITLHARDATVHGVNMRFEPKPEKNTLGWWSNAKDWASWEFELKKPGKFIVFAMHGSNGGSEIEIAVGEQKLNWTTKNTGSYHTFTFLEVGTLNLDTPGPVALTLKPTKKSGGGIMDLREVILLPVLK